MKKLITYLKTLWSRVVGSQRNDVEFDRRLTVGSPSGFTINWTLKLVSVLVLVLTIGIGYAWGATSTLSSAIISSGSTSSSYSSYSFSADGKTWNAYAIHNFHSKATNTVYYLQIKKYASSTAYYVQIPTMPGNITSITMTVSSTSKPKTGGGNSATIFFSNSNSTSATGTGVASGTGASSVTIDCSSLSLTSGYITASGAVRIWDIAVTYETGSGSTCATPTFSPAGGSSFCGETDVTLSCATAGATIRYTTNGEDPTESSTAYSSAIHLSATTTIKAKAFKAGSTASSVASATYTKTASLTTMDDIYSAATDAGSTSTAVCVEFDDWVVSGASSNGRNVYVTNGSKGFIIYGRILTS